MRIPYVIDKNVKDVYHPSPATQQLLGELNRQLEPEDFEWDADLCPSLVTLCVQAVCKQFEEHPLLELPFCADRDHLLQILPTDLPLELVVPLIHDEIYWRRRYVDKYRLVMRKRRNVVSWKSLFLERHMQDLIEGAQPQYADEEGMQDITALLSPHVFTLEVTQLQAWKPPLTWSEEDIPEVYPSDHINFEHVLKGLENIQEFDLVYGMRDVSDDFDWRMFEITKDDCRNLGRGILLLKQIRVLRLHRSCLKDEQVQALMQGLIKNKTLEELDLSHCVIRDHGALCIAKVISVHPNIKTLLLSDNQIEVQGAEGLAFAILQESSAPVSHLDLRLNPLGHEGCTAIMRALVRTDKLVRVSLASCGFDTQTAVFVGAMLCLNSSLKWLDISNNWLYEEGGESILEALQGNNRTIEWLDLRETDIPREYMVRINRYLLRNRGKLEEEEVEDDEEKEEKEVDEVELDAEDEKVEREEQGAVGVEGAAEG